jgi:primosomal protein N'
LPLSSVSDFERFALKSKKRIAAKVKKTEEDASAYALQKEEAAQQEIEHWLRQSRAEWKQALSAKRKRGEKAISDEVKRGWSAYAKEHKTALEAALKVRLSAEFPALAACFIAWVSKKYETGVFTMPRAYAGSVKSEFFEVIECEDEQIVFTSGNLYIEYSVERIIEELADDIASCMRFGEAPWQG